MKDVPRPGPPPERRARSLAQSQADGPPQRPARGSHRRALRVMLALAALLASGALGAAALWQARGAVPGWTQRTPPREPASPSLTEIKGRLTQSRSGLNTSDYLTLALYLVQGWSQYRTPEGARAHYPGLPSQAGRAADGLEGLSRILPLAAVMLARSEDPVLNATVPSDLRVVHHASGEARAGLRLSEALRAGLIAGTDREHPAYWGDIQSYQPQYVEAADIALAIWIARDALWEPLNEAQRHQLTTWLIGSLSALPFDGNWQMFPLIVHRSLQALGIDVRRYDARMQTHWERLLHLHRGGGWFHDPPNGIDYYSVWSIHYGLYWLRRMDPTFGGEIVPVLQGEMASFLRHLMGPRGHPALGRSTCYRMALPTPLLASLHTAPQAIPAGQALRALDLTWAGFIARGALAAGAPTAGLCQPDPALQARYSGPASCLWAARSLVVALDLDRLHPGLLDRPREALPAERDDYTLRHAATGWTVQAVAQTGHIELRQATPSGPSSDPPLQDYRPSHRWAEWVLHRPLRPDNHPALYRRQRYSTEDELFRGCKASP